MKNNKSRTNKKSKSNKNKKGGGCGCGMKTSLIGGSGYSNLQPVGQVPYGLSPDLGKMIPASSNYAGTNASLYQSGTGGSISGGGKTKYRKRNGKTNKRRTNKRKLKGGTNWLNQLALNSNAMPSPVLGGNMQSFFYQPSSVAFRQMV